MRVLGIDLIEHKIAMSAFCLNIVKLFAALDDMRRKEIIY